MNDREGELWKESYGEYGVFIISYSAVQDQGPMNLLI